MSETELAANQRTDDAADAAENELGKKGPESGMRPAAPQEGTDQAANIRSQVEKLGELRKVPSLEAVLAEIDEVPQGDKKGAGRMAFKFGSKPFKYVRRVTDKATENGCGWHCEAIKGNRPDITVAQSQAIADAINSKVEQNAASSEQKEVETIEGMIREVEAADDMKALSKVVFNAHRRGFLLRIVKDKKWRVEVITDKEGSRELVKAVNARRRHLIAIYEYALQLEREKEKTARRIAGIVKAINEQPDAYKLEKYVWQTLVQKLKLVKKRTTPNGKGYIVEPIPDVEGSQEICEAIDAKKKNF